MRNIPVPAAIPAAEMRRIVLAALVEASDRSHGKLVQTQAIIVADRHCINMTRTLQQLVNLGFAAGCDPHGHWHWRPTDKGREAAKMIGGGS